MEKTKKQWIKNGNFWDGISILLGDSRIWNPSEEQLAEAGYAEYVEPEPTPAELLQRAKDSKIAEIEAYNVSDSVNEFTVDGSPMWLDFDERSRLQKAVDAKEALGKTEMTKNWGGVEYTFSIQQWKQMLVALEEYAYDCQNVTDGHRAAIESLGTVDEVLGYDYRVGYPKRLVFDVKELM